MERIDFLKELEKRNALSEDEKAELADLQTDEHECNCHEYKQMFLDHISTLEEHNNELNKAIKEAKAILTSDECITKNLPKLMAEIDFHSIKQANTVCEFKSSLVKAVMPKGLLELLEHIVKED